MDFAVLVDQRVKIQENEKRDKYLDFAKKTRNARKHKGNSDTNCKWHTWNDL